jgi:glycosyltransferase involved in cell wall biosynthesis
VILDALSLFFPCHNEEGNVQALLEDALKIGPQVAKAFEVLIIDDGSRDRTADLVTTFSRRDSRIRLLQHPVCQGYGAALRSGFKAARYPWIFYSDGDRQFNLFELPRLIERSADYDIISGVRAHRADAWPRRLNAWIYRVALSALMGVRVPDPNCAFKLYRQTIMAGLTLKTSGALINAEIFAKAAKAGARMTFVPVSHRPRTAGQQSGARPDVIFKAMKEFGCLFNDRD